MSKGAAITIGVTLLVLLPIWRSVQHSRHEGVNFFQYLSDTMHHNFIPYDQAVDNARSAFEEVI